MNTNTYFPVAFLLLVLGCFLGGCNDDLSGFEVDCEPTEPIIECGDEDGDGVCDEDDVCVGGDDTVDTDGDGVPDDCEIACEPLGDAWSCDEPLNDECVRMVFADRAVWVCEPQCEDYFRMVYGSCAQWYCDSEPFGECSPDH